MARCLAGHFPGMQKSQYLSTLFQINSIPKGDMATSDTAADTPAQ
jgi:hypothetical protein